MRSTCAHTKLNYCIFVQAYLLKTIYKFDIYKTETVTSLVNAFNRHNDYYDVNTCMAYSKQLVNVSVQFTIECKYDYLMSCSVKLNKIKQCYKEVYFKPRDQRELHGNEHVLYQITELYVYMWHKWKGNNTVNQKTRIRLFQNKFFIKIFQMLNFDLNKDKFYYFY